jgi:predicted nucleotidyltransferase
MRLSQHYADTIRQAAHDVFGPDAVVRLFGSRVDDSKRGGDIDLHVEANPEVANIDKRIEFQVELWKRLDEEQKIDVVVQPFGAPTRWIERAALRDGIIL